MAKKNLLIGFTASVATIKDKELVDGFLQIGEFDIKLLYTATSVHFSQILKDHQVHELQAYKGCEIYFDKDEYRWKGLNDPVLHIDLKNWADLLLIAPLSANTLTKIVSGQCDNTLTLVLRAWKFSGGKIVKPIVVCPAMNTDMYMHPVTGPQLKQLEIWGFKVLYPIEKVLACKEVGVGAMENIPVIIQEVLNKFINI